MSLYPFSVNDIDLATAKVIVSTEVYLFYDEWLRMTRGRQTLNQAVVFRAADEERVFCLAQDLIHCASHGRATFSKHVNLAMSVRHVTGSKQLVSILNQIGHC